MDAMTTSNDTDVISLTPETSDTVEGSSSPIPLVILMVSVVLLILGTITALVLNLMTSVVLYKFCGPLPNHLKLVRNQCVLDMLFPVIVVFVCCCLVMADLLNHLIGSLFGTVIMEIMCLTICLISANLSVITFDHFIAIYTPLKYTTTVTGRRVTITIVSMYVIAIGAYMCVWAGRAIEWALYGEDDPFGYYIDKLELFENTFYATCGFTVICAVVMIVVYSYIVYIVFHTNLNQNAQADFRSKIKATITSFFVVITFVVCVCTFFIRRCVVGFFGRDGHWTLFFFSLVPLNSVFDAIIYAVRLPRIRKGYREMCKCTKRTDDYELRSRRTTCTSKISAVSPSLIPQY